MIVCRECGRHAADGTVFCGHCGTFLEWGGERLDDADDPGAGDARDTGDTGDTEGAAAPAAATGRGDYVRQPQRGHRSDRAPAPRTLRRPSGALVCGRCGNGNGPDRRFCSRCGASLADARVYERPSWWRRLLFTERTYAAGERRGPRHRGRWVVRLGLLLLVVALVVTALGPLRPTIESWYRNLTGSLAQPVQVRPEVVTTSGASSGHPARLAFDGATNTYWAAPAPAVPWIRAQFAQPTDVRYVGITAGVSGRTPAFLAAPRPRIVQVEVFSGDRKTSVRLDLRDDPGFQRFELKARAVRALLFRVVASTGSTPRVATAITEIEVFAGAR